MGWLLLLIHSICTCHADSFGVLARCADTLLRCDADYLQYTITSRKEMPNAKFVEEIARAAAEVYNLYDVKPRL